MDQERKICSLQNAKIKRLVALQKKSSERRAQGVFVVEGRREITHCMKAGYQIVALYYCPEIYNDVESDTAEEDVVGLLMNAHQADAPSMYELTREVYEKVSYRTGTEGVVAEVVMPQRTLEDLTLGDAPLLMIVESVEKPGNLGAILRSADAAAATAVICCDPLTDLYNPNIIRSSIGAVFSVPTVSCSSEECIAFLKAKGIRILTAQLQDSYLYYDTDMRGATALVMGTEATGLTEVWRQAADAHIRIPMLGALDSLNVSVSAAILLFEAVRQRGKEQGVRGKE